MRTLGTLFSVLALGVIGCDAAHTPDADAAMHDSGTPVDAAAASVECPVVATTLIGQACDAEGALCGDTCCSDAAFCTGGTWTREPLMECFLCSAYACGDGICRTGQTCVGRCGLAGGTRFTCASRASGCEDCSCIAITSSQRCEMIDGHPHVSESGPCI